MSERAFRVVHTFLNIATVAASLINVVKIILDGDIETVHYGTLLAFILHSVTSVAIDIFYLRPSGSKTWRTALFTHSTATFIFSWLLYWKYRGIGHCEKERKCKDLSETKRPPLRHVALLSAMIMTSILIFFI